MISFNKEALKKNLAWIAGGFILVLLLIVFVVRPSIIGYSVYNEIKKSDVPKEDFIKGIEELKIQLLISDTNLSMCNTFNKDLLVELEKCSDKSSDCNSELSALQKDFEKCENDFLETTEKLNQDLSDKDNEVINLNLKYDLLAQNTANNLCCKAKVDNSNIKYYMVDNDKVVCLEEGTLEITC